MRQQIGAMIRPFVLLAALAVPAFGGEGITATVGVTPSCPYGLAG
jgi:hypothetical protein